MTRAEVKAILGYTDTTHDDRIDALLPGIEDFARGYCNNDFLVAKPLVTGEDISFSVNTISSVTTDFSDFKTGHEAIVGDSLYNDVKLTIASVATNSMVVDETLITEIAGEEITITRTILPKAVKIAIAKMIAFEITMKPGLKSKRLGDGNEVYSSVYPEDILNMLPRSVSFV